jgi:hypothetical protein
MVCFPASVGQSQITHDIIDEEMPDADEEPEREPTPVEQPPPPKPAELKEEVTVQGGRRRGKRQVMKKRTVKDEEGYLGKYKYHHLNSLQSTILTFVQSPERNLHGSHSPKMSRPRLRRSRLSTCPKAKARRLDRETLCRSSAKSNRSHRHGV